MKRLPFRFREFPVYGDLRRFSRRLKDLAKCHFPPHERYGLSDQLKRALDSIILNVAEGSSRGTDKDFAHYLNLSTSSLQEAVACLDIALDCGCVSAGLHEVCLSDAARISEQLTGFRRFVLANPTK